MEHPRLTWGRTDSLMTFQIEFRPQQVADSAFIASQTTILGDVTIGPGSSVWFGSVIRGDTEKITVGENSNVQDLSLLHADPGFPCRIGDRVTVGHGAIIHGATIEDDTMIGMRAVVLNGARVGSGSIVAAGAVITEGREIPPRSFVAGVPAKIRSEVTDRHREMIQHAANHYTLAAKTYRQNGR